ncbi:50S ribosomal protein L13, partial [Candidatus Peregrinibacteria bacterium CG11_big_fil_rev_8_21_14_0_20_46_8]
IYQTYSGYPGGQKKYALEVMLQKSPAKVLEVAVNRMIPSGPLGNKIRTKLKVYAGEKHPHAAQKPEPVTII